MVLHMITVPLVVLPVLRRALLEVQPVLVDLAAAQPAASSSSDSNDEQGAAKQGPNMAAALGDGGHLADQRLRAGQLHVTSGSGSNTWRRILVHLSKAAVALGDSSTSSSDELVQQAAVAGRRVREALLQQHGMAAELCTVRCWYECTPDGTDGRSPCWEEALVGSMREQLGGQQVAVQFVPVSQVASSVGPAACWAVLEAHAC